MRLTPEQAYRAMFAFLEANYERTKSDDLGVLLGGLSLTPDGTSSDPSAWADWLAAINKVASSKVDISRRTADGRIF